MTQELGPLARTLSLPYYDDALPAHDGFHANRVRNLAVRLARDLEGPVDTDVLSAAAWFHDIGRPLERTGEIEDHDEWAAAEATDLLATEATDLPATEAVTPGQIDAVEHCIRAHSIRSSSPEPETPEAKLLFDADKLDATGAVGIVRLACIVGERSGRAGAKYAAIDDSSTLGGDIAEQRDVTLLREWATERLELLYTSPARRLGRSRLAFMDEFFARFDSETGIDAER